MNTGEASLPQSGHHGQETTVRPSRCDDTGCRQSASERWDTNRLDPPDPLGGSNGVALGAGGTSRSPGAGKQRSPCGQP